MIWRTSPDGWISFDALALVRPVGGGRGDQVVVTGGAGFIGSHLCDALAARGDRVVVIDTFAQGDKLPAALRPQVEVLDVDVRDRSAIRRALEGSRFVYHFAAVLGVDNVADHPVLTMETEALGLQNIAAACVEHRVERLIYASTSGVYGHSAIERTVSEDVPLDPRTSYSIAKRFNEIYLQALHREQRLESVAVRLFNVYGPRQDERMVIPRFLARARAGEPLRVYGSGRQTRDFTHVDDVCRACLDLAHRSRGAEIFNIARGIETSIFELAETIVALTGSSSAIERLEVPRARYDFEVQRRVGCADKLERRLGVRPGIDLEDGLRRLLGGVENDRTQGVVEPKGV